MKLIPLSGASSFHPLCHRAAAALLLLLPAMPSALADGGQGGGGVSGPPTTFVDFEGRPQGILPPRAITGVSFATEVEVIDAGTQTASPTHALRSRGPGEFHTGPMRWYFDSPQGFVRLFTGNPVGGALPQRVQLRGYRWRAGSWELCASAETTFGTYTGLLTELEICQPIGQDIGMVELDAGVGFEQMDDLFFGRLDPGHVTRITFDNLAPGQTVTTQYDGMTSVPEPVENASNFIEAYPGTDTPPQLLRQNGSESAAGPIRLRLDPPQGAVRLRTGYPYPVHPGQPITIRLVAFGGADGLTPLGEARRVVTSQTSITLPLEVCRWEERDITAVELICEGAFAVREALDTLEFAPVRPAPRGVDRTPPALSLTAPSDGAVITAAGPADLLVNVPVTFRATEAVALGTTRLILSRAGAPDDIQVLTPVGSAPYFTFNASVSALVENDYTLRIECSDAAGNAALPLLSTFSARRIPRLPEQIITAQEPAELFPEWHVWATPNGDREFPPPVVTLRGTGFRPDVRVEVEGVDPASRVPVVPLEMTSSLIRLRIPDHFFPARDAAPLPVRVLLLDPSPLRSGSGVTYSAAFQLRSHHYMRLCTPRQQNAEGPNSEFDWQFLFDADSRSLVTHCEIGWIAELKRDCYIDLMNPPQPPGGPPAGGTCYGMALMAQECADPVRMEQILFEARSPQAIQIMSHLTQPNWTTVPGSCLTRVPQRLQGGDWGRMGRGSSAAWLQAMHGVQSDKWHLESMYRQLSDSTPNRLFQPERAWRTLTGGPTAYVLCFNPAGTMAGHCVAPYQLTTETRTVAGVPVSFHRVRVYDSNYPYNSNLPDTHPQNVRAMNRWVEITSTPTGSTYRYEFSYNRDGTPVVWDGTRIYTSVPGITPGNHLLPDFDTALRAFAWLVSASGEARAHCQAENGEEVGWKADGSWVMNTEYIVPWQPVGAYADTPDAVTCFFPTSHESITTTLRHTGTNEAKLTAFMGHQGWQAEAASAAGAADQFVFRSGKNIPDSVSLTTTAPARLRLRTAMQDVASEHRFSLGIAVLPAAHALCIEALPGTESLRLLNDGGADLPVQLAWEKRNSTGGEERHLLAPVSIAAGAAATLRITNAKPELLIDLGQDGTIDSVLEPPVQSTSPASAAEDCNGNGITDMLEILNGTLHDANGNGMADECEPPVVSTPASVFWTNTDAAAVEGVPAVIGLQRTGSLKEPLTVQIEPVGGTAKAPGDFDGGPVTVTFAAGSDSAVFEFHALEDCVAEEQEKLHLHIASSSPAVLLPALDLPVLITDASLPEITIDSLSVDEGSGSTPAHHVMTLHLSRPMPCPVPFRLVATPGTATFDDCSFAGTGVQRWFAPGNVTETVEVFIAGDTTPEADESFKLSVDSLTNATFAGGGDIILLNDDGPDTPGFVAFDGTYFKVTEGAPLSVRLVRTGGSLGPVEVLVQLDPLPSGPTITIDEINGGDIAPRSAIVTFASGQTQQTVDFPTTDDAGFEGDEFFALTLHASGQNPATIGSPATAGGVIHDNDAAPAGGRFSVDSISVVEGRGNICARFEVTLDTPQTQPATVTLVPESGTAVAGQDFAAAPLAVFFAPGEMSRTVDVPLVHGSELEGPEFFTVRLDSPGAGLTIAPLASGGRGRADILPFTWESVQIGAEKSQLLFPSAQRQSFQVERSEDLLNWFPVGSTADGTGAPLLWTGPGTNSQGSPQRFFRVKIQPRQQP